MWWAITRLHTTLSQYTRGENNKYESSQHQLHHAIYSQRKLFVWTRCLGILLMSAANKTSARHYALTSYLISESNVNIFAIIINQAYNFTYLYLLLDMYTVKNIARDGCVLIFLLILLTPFIRTWVYLECPQVFVWCGLEMNIPPTRWLF